MTPRASRVDGACGWRPDQWLFLLLIATLPVVWPFSITIRGLVVVAADFVFVGAGLAWVIAVTRERTQVRPTRFYLPLALYLAAMVVSAIVSDDPRRSAFKLCGEAYLIALAALTFNLASSLPFVRAIMRAWLVGTTLTVVAGVLGIVLFYAGLTRPTVNPMLSIYGSLPPGPYPRILALFANPNMLCTYLVISMMVIVAMRRLEWLDAWSTWLLIGGISITAIFTMSPGLGGLFLCAALWGNIRLWQTTPRLGRWLLAVGVLAAVAFVGATMISPVSGVPLEVRGLGVRLEPSSRALAWQSALATFHQHPLFGRGVGLEVAAVHYRNASGHMEHLTDAHNVWLSIAGQEGLVGLLAFTSIVWYLLWGIGALHAGDAPQSVATTALVIAFIGGFLYQSLSGSFEHARHVWVLMGLLAAVRAPGMGHHPVSGQPTASAVVGPTGAA